MKKLKKGSDYDMSGCCWNAHSIVGGVFIVIATILTLITQSGFGILGLFLVGAILWHKGHWGNCCDKSQSKDECCDVEKHDIEKPTPKRAAVKK